MLRHVGRAFRGRWDASLGPTNAPGPGCLADTASTCAPPPARHRAIETRPQQEPGPWPRQARRLRAGAGERSLLSDFTTRDITRAQP